MKTIRLQTDRPKIAFMVMAALYYSMRHPAAATRLPIKMSRVLFGSGIGNSTLHLLKRLTWQIETGECLPVFEAVLPDQAMKVEDCSVVFHPMLTACVSGEDPTLCRVGLFHGMTDISTLAFEYAEKEIDREWADWTPQSLEKLFLSDLRAKQTPAGSAIHRKVKFCPVCRKPLGTLIYGAAKNLKKAMGSRSFAKTPLIVGSPATPEPRPKWMCPGCGLIIWQRL